jgi:DNA polymerase sigma
VKLVQFQDAATWIKVDMSFNQVAGISSGNVLNISLDAIKPARPLMLLVKYLLASHGLSEPFTGGLGSHPLAIIVLSFLKNAAACVDGAPEEDLGLLFLDFLSFYGQIFNWYLAGISIDGFFPKREKKHFEFGGKLWRPFVEDCIPPCAFLWTCQCQDGQLSFAPM